MFSIPQSKVSDSISMVRATDLNKTVRTSSGPLTILENITLDINRGESVAIVGASGSGKSTLLGLLAGLDVPTSGQVWLDNDEITALDEEQRAAVRGKLVGFVFQNFQLLPGLTALENVMLPLELKGASDARQLAQDTLQRVGLQARFGHYPKQLSGGEQQRVALARAFATQPSILFADEPTGNLDGKTGGHVESLLLELNREFETTLILVTHDNRLAEQCDTQIRLELGHII